MATNRTVQQVIDLQNRITALSAQGRLDELTHGEVALISYALGRYHAELLQEERAPIPPTPRAEPRSRLPRSTLARDKAKAGK